MKKYNNLLKGCYIELENIEPSDIKEFQILIEKLKPVAKQFGGWIGLENDVLAEEPLLMYMSMNFKVYIESNTLQTSNHSNRLINENYLEELKLLNEIINLN